ncbi:MAG: tetratricopeptide repeat protein [Armatimonadetes bacterium]|nr:MAG: tetratricopeptide repeat protein [Armatimonadota bacterium]
MELHKSDDFVFVAVAMDVGGIAACKKYYDEAKASYVQLVDSQNALGEALGFKVIPNGFFLDEAGRLVDSIVGRFEVRSPQTIDKVEAFLAMPKAQAGEARPVSDEEQIATLKKRLSDHPDDGDAHLALGKLLLRMGKPADALAPLKRAAELLPKSAPAQFSLGACLLALEKKDAALAQFRKALALDRENYVIRKQIWMIEHPEKFFPEIDWAWQREQLAKERKQEGGGG